MNVDDSTKSGSVSKYATFALNFLEPDAASAALAWVRSEFDKTKALPAGQYTRDTKTFGSTVVRVTSYDGVEGTDGGTLSAGIGLALSPAP